MAAKERSEAGCMFARDIAVACVLIAVGTIVLPHEGVGVFVHPVAHFRVLLHVGLQCGVLVHKFPVVYERRILAKLFGNFAVAVGELIEPCRVLARAVIVAACCVPVTASGVVIAACRVIVVPSGVVVTACCVPVTASGVVIAACRVVVVPSGVVATPWRVLVAASGV